MAKQATPVDSGRARSSAAVGSATVPSSKKPAAKRAATKSTATKTAEPAKRAPAKRAPAKRAPAKRAPAKRVPAQKPASTSAAADPDASNRPTESAEATVQSPRSPREARRLQRIELSREQILDTAEELFAEKGYYETGLKDVAERCEFSVGSIYTFFENKDNLYEQVLMRRSIGFESIHELVPDSVPADERLVRLAEIQIRHAREHPAWGTLTAEISRMARSRGAVVPEPWEHYGQRVFAFLVGVFEKGHQEGTLRSGSPAALARLYHAVVSSFILISVLHPMTPEGEWPSDTEWFLRFIRDTFSSAESAD